MTASFNSNESWHARPAEELFPALQTAPTGLTTEKAAERLQRMGPNTLARIRAESVFHLVWRQLRNPLIYVLLAAAGLAIGMGKMTDGLVVLGVVVLNTIMGVVQEYQAGQAIQGLLQMIPDMATVWRDGNQKNIPAAQLVPGDYVLLQAGDRVSADIRLTSAKSLQCDESALTGESVPVAKQPEPVPPEAAIGDRKCMAFSGTMVTAGAGAGIVVGTGTQTELGKISQLLESTTSLETPLTRSLGKVARWITLAILVVGLVIFGISLVRGYSWLEATFSAISLAVAAIPEGLPAVITIASAVGVRRMARRRAIIRHLPAVETLGSTTVICSDKTGTLTRNQMTVQALWNTQHTFELSGSGVDPQGKITRPGANEPASEAEVGALLLAGALCNDASLEEEGAGNWQVTGDPTEVALVVAAEKFGLDEKQARQQWPRLDTIPFDADRKFMATLHVSPEGEKFIYLKGAPESVIPLSDGGNNQQQPVPAGPEVKQEAWQKAHQLADAGMRVLAFARKKANPTQLSLTEQDLQQGFQLLGLQAMMDPPRTEVRPAIAACQQAGITVKMITGDHPGTAAAIGLELGLIQPGANVLTGTDLQQMPDEILQEVVEHTHIFARVAPEHKLRLVQALQFRNNVVAMTGDGVNDAPALKRADIGVAMGITGTAVSKEAADMILTDDNFESIAAAVEEGRRVYDNLLKSLAFILPTSMGLGLVIVIAVLFFPTENGVPLHPMEPVQVLWINLITAVALSLPLSLEAMEPDVMRRPPRQRDAPLLSKFVFFRMVSVALVMAAGTVGLFLWEYRLEIGRGRSQPLALAEAQTMAVTAMVLFQVFYLLNCRSLKYALRDIGFFSNPAVFYGILVVLLAQLAFVYLPLMNIWFGSAPLPAVAWAVSAAVAFTIVPVITFEKWIRARNNR